MNIINSFTGFIHLTTAFLSLISGTLVLAKRKGTSRHKKMGYAYVVSMTLMLGTSFMLYDLFGKWGIFHYGSVASAITLFFGVYPSIRRQGNWVVWHFSMMYWSIIGLYAAFVSEVFTRTLPTPFFTGVGIGTALIMIAGAIGFKIHSKKWETQFKTYNQKR